MTESADVLLVDPKYDFNVGGAVRASAIFDARQVTWSGDRVLVGGRLPREERMKGYEQVRKMRIESGQERWFIDGRFDWGITPVAVEFRENAETLGQFVHPDRALYVFGPEDGTLGRGILGRCHRFVCIPGVARAPLNLAAAVNVVLYDRFVRRELDRSANRHFERMRKELHR